MIGLAAPLVAGGIRALALLVRPSVERRRVLLTPAVGIVVGLLAIAYGEISGKNSSEVLFSGQSALPPLVANSASYTVPTLLLLIACKSLGYGMSLSSFRGGPVFPAIFLGAAGGIAMSHLPGLPMVPAVAMGIGAMAVSMLGLPLTSVMLATLLLSSDALAVMPLAIVSVVVAYVASAQLPIGRQPQPAPAPARQPS